MQGSKRTGPEDGLDELLKGIEDLNGTVPTGSLPQLPDSDEEDPLLNDEAELALQDSEEDDSEEEESLDSDGMEALDDDGQLLQEVDDDDDEVAVDFGDDGGDELGPNEHGGSARGTGASSSDDDEEDGELHEGGGALMPAGGQQGREATAMNGVEGESDDEEGSDGSGEEPPQLVEAVQQGKRMPGAFPHREPAQVPCSSCTCVGRAQQCTHSFRVFSPRFSLTNSHLFSTFVLSMTRNLYI